MQAMYGMNLALHLDWRVSLQIKRRQERDKVGFEIRYLSLYPTVPTYGITNGWGLPSDTGHR
jgi:hypothetical protein